MDSYVQLFQQKQRKDAPELAFLVSMMKDHPCTSGWDAVCSYDGNVLNGILADQFKDLHQVTTVKLGTPESPYRTGYTTFNIPHVTKGVTMTQVNYSFGLDIPRLQFSPVDAKAVLVMPITSAKQAGFAYTLTYASDADQAGGDLKEDTWYLRDDARQFREKTQQEMLADCWDAAKGQAKDPFPANYFYKVANADVIPDFNKKVYLLTSVDPAFPPEGVGKDASDPFGGKKYLLQGQVPLAAVAGNQVHPTGMVVTFDASKGKTDGQIILNFDVAAGEGAEFSLLDATGSDSMPALLKDAPTLLEDLKVYFSKALSDVQLTLAGVAVGKISDGIPVRPRSFVFWATQVGDCPVLSIYLNIDGSATPNPSGPPAFQYNNGGVGIPVPQGYTGSLILSRDYLTRNYFLQAFSRSGFGNMTPAGDALSPISFSGSYHKATTVYGNKVDVSFSFSDIFSGFDSADYGTFHVDDYQFSFTLNNDNTLSISSGQVATATIPVYIHYTIGGGTHGVTQHLTDQRTTWATLFINKSISFSDAQPSSEGFSLSFSVKQTDYGVSSSSDIGGICDDHTQRDVEAKLRQALGDIAPAITVKLPELETFAIDNMLFNGEVKFKLDPKSKMNFPHDLLLVGALS